MAYNHTNRGGYVLVMTLGLLALAAIASVGLARHSLRLASTAQQASSDLQRRWGLFSARYVLLDRAPEILVTQVPPDELDTPPWPKPAKVSATFMLGAQEFTVTLADEDAKADLNTIYARQERQLHSVVRQLTRDAAGTVPNVRLMPAENARQAFRSWGQVFDLTATPAECDIANVAGRELTCWGHGKLNLRTASDAVLRVVAGLALPAGKVGQLVDLRKHWGGQGVDALVDELELHRPQYLAIKRLVGTESRSYSLSLSITNGQRQREYLFVDDGRLESFVW